MKQQFTTGEIARMCFVSTATVARWCDRDGLKHRRQFRIGRIIERADLEEFLHRHGMIDFLIRHDAQQRFAEALLNA